MIYLPANVAKRIKAHDYIKQLDFDKLKDNPICPRCERVALRTEGWSTNNIAECPSCHYKGRMTVTLEEYANRMLYK